MEYGIKIEHYKTYITADAGYCDENGEAKSNRTKVFLSETKNIAQAEEEAISIVKPAHWPYYNLSRNQSQGN